MTAIYHGPSRLVFVRFGALVSAGKSVSDALAAMHLLLAWRRGVPSC